MKKRAYNIVPYSTSRESRFNETLSPESVAIDGKKIEEFLTFISEYAKHINYYGLNNKKAGNWHSFFSQSDVIFLSMLMKTDIRSLNEKKNTLYEKCTHSIYAHSKEENTEAFQLFFIELVEMFYTWYVQAIKVQEEAITYELKNAVNNRLLRELEAAITQKEEIANSPVVKERLYKIYQHWHHKMSSRIKPSVAGENFKLTNDPEILGASCNVFLNSIRYILRQVPGWLEYALKEEESHTPHIGLMLAFLNLHNHVKEQFNDLSTKHLNYYYRNLLQQKELPKIPDRCVVFLDLAKEAPYAILKKGTRLSAGQTNEGKEIIYHTLEEEELSRAKLAEIRTLFISTNPIIAPLNKSKLVTGIYAYKKDITTKNLLNEEPYTFHLFGTDPFGNLNAIQNTTTQPNIGWAIAAPVFSMKEGERSVSLAIRFEEKSMAIMWEYIKTMAKASDEPETEVLYHFFSSSFDLKITGEKGWIAIEKYAIDFRKEEGSQYINEIVFLFTFDKKTAPITGFKPEVHLLQYDTHFPVLQMALQSNNTYYPYSLLKDAIVDEVTINIECEGIKNLQLYDAFGKLESNKPFQPFGATPLKGDSFYIGYEELYEKKLTSMSLDVNWYQLPQEGFESYYQGYPGDIDNNSFTFTISALSLGEWIPKEEYRQKMQLFEEENGVLSDTSTYVIDTEKTYSAPELKTTDIPFSFETANNGFFKMELEDPDMGFGQKAHLKILTNNVYENINARNSRKQKAFVVPESPYTPKMRSLRMHYSATQHISFNTSGDERDVSPFGFFHLEPFGILKVANLRHVKANSLVPRFDNRGYLYLGLQDIASDEPLSLYFDIITKTDTTKDVDTGGIEWEYLSGISWKSIEKERIIKDDTLGFTSSGIVKIYTPENIENYHPLFPEAAFWLRISSPNALDIIRNCSYINTRAVLIEQDINAADTTTESPLPKNTFTALYDKNKNVKSVLQPFPSYGKRPAEITKDFYNRVSERLFHKNRALNTGDYERLILEQFPEIFQVSCLTSTLFPGEIAPNEIVLMVLRNIELNDPSAHRKFNITVLERVKEYISKLCPPSVKITVRNPVYEMIRVSCEVKLKDHRLSGEKLKKLARSINAHIAPWLYHKDRETEYKKFILHTKGIENLIAKQDYVEFITNFSLVQFNQQGDYRYTYKDTAVGTTISPSRPWSVFIPADTHNIELISDHATQDPTPLKIGVMKIEDDFILQPEEGSGEGTAETVTGTNDDDDKRRIVLKVRF